MGFDTLLNDVRRVLQYKVFHPPALFALGDTGTLSLIG